MPKAKTWPDLTRRQRREVRAYLREELDFWCSEEGRLDGFDHKEARFVRMFAEALRAALRQLAEPKRRTRG